MKNVFIIEDNDMSYISVEKILSPYNVKLTRAVDGQDFYSKIMTTPFDFDLVLMDIMLPDTTGIELSKFLINGNFGIPIVVISAYTENCEEIFELGIEYFVSKPIMNELFISIVKKFIEIEALVV